MSLPSWERETSKAEYIKELFDLCIYIGHTVVKQPAKYRTNYGDHLIKTSLDALKHAQAAQSIYMSEKTTEADYQRRRAHLQNARAFARHTATAADIFLELVKETDGAKPDKIEKREKEIGSKTKRIEALISGVIDSDKAIFSGRKKPKSR